MMKQAYFFFLPFLGVLLLSAMSASCSKGKVALSDDGLKARELNQLIEQIRQSYVNRELGKVAALFAPEGPIPPERVRETLTNVYQENEPVSLGFFIERIVLKERSSEVHVHWEGEWRREGEDRVHMERGNAVLMIRGEAKPLVWNIQGDSFLTGGEPLDD